MALRAACTAGVNLSRDQRWRTGLFAWLPLQAFLQPQALLNLLAYLTRHASQPAGQSKHAERASELAKLWNTSTSGQLHSSSTEQMHITSCFHTTFVPCLCYENRLPQLKTGGAENWGLDFAPPVGTDDSNSYHVLHRLFLVHV